METTSFSVMRTNDRAESSGAELENSELNEDDVGLVEAPQQNGRGNKAVFYLRQYWKSGVIVGAPLVLLPLALGTQAAKAGYVVALVALFWVTEVAPLAAVALLPLSLFPLLGILNASDAASAYLQDANLLFTGGLIIAVAVEAWKLHERIALRVLLLLGTSKSMLLLGFMGVTAFLSMWISNTATSAMMLPIANAVLEALERDSDETTESSRQVASESHQEGGDDGLADVQARSSSSSSPRNVSFRKGMMLAVAYSATIGGIATLTGTGPNIVMAGQIKALYPNAPGVNFGQWILVGLPTALLLLGLGWLWMSFLFDRQGSLLHRLYLYLRRRQRRRGQYEINQEQRDSASVRAVIQQRYSALGRLSFAERVILVDFILLIVAWFLRDPGFIGGWGDLFRSTPEGKSYVSDSTAAMFFAVILFFLPSEWPFSRANRTSSRPIKRILDWKVVERNLPWSVIILLGGGFCLARGVKASQLSCWFGLKLHGLNHLNIELVLLLTIVFILLFTEVASNVASATIFLPILAELAAVSLHKNPLWLMVPATITCSFAFMLPAATPPNAIAFSYGSLTVPDMVKTGAVMNVIGAMTIYLMTVTVGYRVFDLGTFPAWAASNATAAGSCTQAMDAAIGLANTTANVSSVL